MSLRLFRVVVVSVVVGAGVAVVPATGAFAHDQLISSSPSDGESFNASPSVVELEFNEDVLTLGAVVIVVDEAGRDWVSGDAQLDGSTVTATVDGTLPEAGYQVRWRVVSGDGHPITGIIPFTVGDAKPFDTTAADAASDPGTAPAPDDPDDAEQQETSQSSSQPDLTRVATVGGIGAAAAVLALVGFSFISRRRARGGTGAP